MEKVELVSNGAVMAEDSQHTEKRDVFSSLPAKMILLAVFPPRVQLLIIWQLLDISI